MTFDLSAKLNEVITLFSKLLIILTYRKKEHSMISPTSFQRASKIAAHPLFIKKNIIAEKGVTIGYAKYRMLRPIFKVYYSIFFLFHPNCPWTTPASIIVFKKLLSDKMTALEFGSGKSTIFLAKRTKHLVSVEHDERWYKLVKYDLKIQNFDNVDYRFIPKNEMLIGDLHSQYRPTSFPIYNISKDFFFRSEFHSYYEFVKEFPDQYFDFILVAGRARVECLVNSIDKLKPGGMMVLDNSNRKKYQPVVNLLSDWPNVRTTTGLFDTTIWFKPRSHR